MESFVNLLLSDDYRSSANRLAGDFFARLLPLACSYERAVAFFSSSVFFTASDEFSSFFAAGSVMHLVCSPFLEGADIEGMFEGVFDRPRILKERRPVQELLRAGGSKAFLASAVARGWLRIKIATGTPDTPDRLFHEKVGIFHDSDGNRLAFSGSANESKSAWLDNFERVDVFRSWGAELERTKVKRLTLQFDELWRNSTPGLMVWDPAEAIKAGILRGRQRGPDAPISSIPLVGRQVPPEALLPAPDVHLFKHQDEAIRAWGESGGRAVLEMATGSGKTITALTLASRLYDGVGPGLAVLIVGPYIHLIDQWCQVAAQFGLTPIRCAESLVTWRFELQAAVRSLNIGTRPVLSIATTPNTLASPTFQQILQRLQRPLLIIGDEVHNYGAPSVAAALPTNAVFRVGLSATPDRWMDDEGTESIRNYFGPIAYHYGLKEAISDGILTPYRYSPILVDLQATEIDEYLDLTRLLSRYIHGEADGPINEAAKLLLIRRARLLASAAGKLPKLADLLVKRTEESHILVYCGDGQVEGPEPDRTARQVDEAVRMIGRDLHMTCARFTAETPAVRRQEILQLFSSGDIQVLVAIRCLDEGVDLPATKTAFILASSTNPRQFIQRRGRLLRRAPGKKRAEIFDFFVSPPLSDIGPSSPEYPVVRRLFGNQIRRAQEFAALAENAPQARAALRDVTTHFNLFSEWS
jgi:DNA phosphorothioation system restriction enzyme